jgi:hypothetical protein
MNLKDIQQDPTLEGRGYLLPQSTLDSREDPESMFERGNRLRFGNGIQKDEPLAWSLITQAALLGHPLAQAYCFLEGKGVEKDQALAFRIFLACAERGHAVGMYIAWSSDAP